ncbi:hypothetical protein BDZ94DRAFT_1378333 [Collybia nuda]|uniref:Lipase-like C-terminal domain-containing protein n=1 Tax=Collybia nuda TaxID=64659 RepID=A0A9P6CGN5_9AGAR|nr:hypothetical protein BDZ94DRAFT_1378333 [Collybia nuda]
MTPHNHHHHPKSAPIPLIIVDGFLGCGSAVLWGKFSRFLNISSEKCENRRIIFVRVGPVSSLHDRACELYYALTGGTVDYGADHAKLHKHARYGRVNKAGMYPQWSPEQPLHFLGHSIGGSTIIKLQFLLKQRYFGPHVHPDMVLSVNTISAPFRGTQLVYILGECADAAPAVRPLSIGSLLSKWVHLVAFFSPLLPELLDLHVEARSLSFRDMSPVSLLKQLWKSDWAESHDAAPYDMTFEAADERESTLEGRAHPRTFYRSHVASLNSRLLTSSLPTSPLSSILSQPFRLLSHPISTFDYSVIQPAPSFLENDALILSSVSRSSDVVKNTSSTVYSSTLREEYKENDGIVPLFSQWHPLPCRSTQCRHFEHSKNFTLPSPDPGTWNVYHMDAANHISLAPCWTGNFQQRYFWTSLGQWLYSIDDHRHLHNSFSTDELDQYN